MVKIGKDWLDKEEPLAGLNVRDAGRCSVPAGEPYAGAETDCRGGALFIVQREAKTPSVRHRRPPSEHSGS